MARTDTAASAAAKSARVSRPPRKDDGSTTEVRTYQLHWLVIGGLLGAAGWALIGALISFVLGARWLAGALVVLAVALGTVLVATTAIARRRLRTAAEVPAPPAQRSRPLADS
jgi:Flp pilus assembly protein TadB